MHVYQSGDSQPALLVEGSQGSLFSVEDSLTGSLMSVNDIAGLPVFEAFDDGTIVMGQYNSGDFIVTGNKVGIGTSNPDQLLDVRGNVQIKPSTGTDTDGGGAGVLFHVADDAGPGWNIRIGDAADDGSFNIDSRYSSAWSNRFHIKRNGGNVGIGTTDVAGSRLRVDGDVGISGSLHIAALTPTVKIESLPNTVATLHIDSTNAALLDLDAASTSVSCLVKFSAAGADPFYIGRGAWDGVGNSHLHFINSAGATKMVIQTDGKVGISEAAPDSELEIATANVIGVTHTSKVGLHLQSADDGGSIFGHDMNHSILFRFGQDGQNYTTNYYQYGGTLAAGKGHRFYTDSSIQSQSLRLQIANDGCYFSGPVGIGTLAPSGRLHVNNAGTGIIVANEHITGNAFEVHGAQGNLLTITDDLSDSLMSVNDAAGMPVFEVFADETIKEDQNNKSKFEVDNDNSRIRLRDHSYVSGQ